jgi:hypothetical protein
MPDLNELATWAQIISIPLAIIAIWIAIYVYLRSKQRRLLICELDSIQSPIEIKGGEALDGKIEILYQNEKVENLFIVRARIINSGTLPIRKSEVVVPLTFTFEPDVRMLREPREIKKSPSGLTIHWDLNKNDSSNIACLNFDLLNPTDEVTIEFVCTGTSKDPIVTARIEGIKEITLLDAIGRQLRESVMSNIYLLAVHLFGIVVFLGLMAWGYDAILYALEGSHNTWIKILAIILVIFIIGFLFWSVTWIRRSTRSILKYLDYQRKKTGT